MTGLHRQLRILRTSLNLHQYQIAAMIGVHPRSISRWDKGTNAPHARHAIAYARTLGHRVIVTRNGLVIGDLADLLPRLPELRQRAWLTRRAMGARAGTSESASYVVEQHGRTGQALMSSVEWYLEALGYDVRLMPERRERGAA